MHPKKIISIVEHYRNGLKAKLSSLLYQHRWPLIKTIIVAVVFRTAETTGNLNIVYELKCFVLLNLLLFHNVENKN